MEGATAREKTILGGKLRTSTELRGTGAHLMYSRNVWYFVLTLLSSGMNYLQQKREEEPKTQFYRLAIVRTTFFLFDGQVTLFGFVTLVRGLEHYWFLDGQHSQEEWKELASLYKSNREFIEYDATSLQY